MLEHTNMVVDDEGNVSFIGIDMGGKGKIIAENRKAVVVKFPGGTHWGSVLNPRVYHSPCIYVLQKEEEGMIGDVKPNKQGNRRIRLAAEIIYWDVVRGKGNNG